MLCTYDRDTINWPDCIRLLRCLKNVCEECLSFGLVFGFDIKIFNDALKSRLLDSIVSILRHGLLPVSCLCNALEEIFLVPVINTESDFVVDCLTSHTLADQLRNAKANFHRCCMTHYTRSAFLMQPPYFDAFIKCIDSIEQCNPLFLTAIDPFLVTLPIVPSPALSVTDSAIASSFDDYDYNSLTGSYDFSSEFGQQKPFSPLVVQNNVIPLSPGQSRSSSPVLNPTKTSCYPSSAMPNVSPSAGAATPLKAPWKPMHQRSRSDTSVASKSAFSSHQSLCMSPLAIDSSQVISAYESPSRRFDTDGGSYMTLSPSITPALTSPSQSESSLWTGSMQHPFALGINVSGGGGPSTNEDTLHELTNENSHFHICEYVMAVIEQMKWRHAVNKLGSEFGDCAALQSSCMSAFGSVSLPSLTSSQRLEQRFCSPRPESPLSPSWNGQDFGDLYSSSSCDPLNNSSTALYSSSYSASRNYDANNHRNNTGTIDSCSVQKTIPVPSSQISEASTVEAGSAAATAGTARARASWVSESHSSSFEHSAEAVALLLMKKFSQKQQQLMISGLQQYLVSEEDAPQSLLPLPPPSFMVAPDEVWLEGFQQRINLRGSFEWAPPRPQIILQLHPPPKFRALILAQQLKCAGCGLKLERGYLRRVRYCQYFGKYFCLCCHMGSTAMVPARVLHRWDFRQYPVSDLARKFLEQQQSLPIFNILAINPGLYDSVKQLRTVLELRKRLGLVWSYLRICRNADHVITKCGNLNEVFRSVPAHLLEDLHMFSMDDFCATRDKSLNARLLEPLELGVAHVTGCALCTQKGFICELCGNDNDILFPFQDVANVQRCDACGECFHRKCARNLTQCPRCARLQKRQAAQQASFTGGDSPTENFYQ